MHAQAVSTVLHRLPRHRTLARGKELRQKQVVAPDGAYQPPCGRGPLGATAGLELREVEHRQDDEYRNDMKHGTSDRVQYVGRSS
jgi:hypothetical protein